MAYSLNDVYQFLRMVMRLNSLTVGFGLGLLLLVSSQDALAAWGVFAGGAIWPLRMAGGLLVALGAMLLLAAQERIVSGPSMVGMSLANAIVAGVLLLAYLRQELAALTALGQLALVAVFVMCLIGAIFPLRYVRAEYVAH